MKIKQNSKIFILNSIYICLVLLFLHSQFHSSEQSTEISTMKLINNHQKSINSSSHNDPDVSGRKVVFLLIDSSNFAYYKQIPIIPKLLSTSPQKCILKKTKISQPTMTTQKIQALMTGSQVFSSTSIIDAFFSSAVRVDNIIDQVNAHKGRTVFLGDDTWGRLFKFSVSYPCISTFDIWDWDTCDKIIYNNLLDQLTRQKPHRSQNMNIDRRQLIIAHFLALDHIGHSTSSLTHNMFKEKKQQISNLIQKVIQQMSQDYVLVVTGDHGMRDDGNHGGGSDLETQSFVFIYSKGTNIAQLNVQQYKREYVIQPDITTTLSLLLQIPIVSNSIGIPIILKTNPKNQSPQPQPQPQPQQITKSINQHFQQLLQYHRMECNHNSTYLLHNSTDSTNSTLSTLLHVQHNCLSHLSHNESNTILLYCIGFVMIVLCLCLVYLLQVSVCEFVLGVVVAVPHAFSWYIIRNSSTYYLIMCMIVCICILLTQTNKTSTISTTNVTKIIHILIALTVLSQLQVQKVGQYSTNIIRFSILSELICNRFVLISVALVWLYYQVITIYNNNRTQQPNQLYNQNQDQNQNQNRNQNRSEQYNQNQNRNQNQNQNRNQNQNQQYNQNQNQNQQHNRNRNRNRNEQYNQNQNQNKYHTYIQYSYTVLIILSNISKLLQYQPLYHTSNILLTGLVITIILVYIIDSLFGIGSGWSRLYLYHMIQYYLIIFLPDNAILIYLASKHILRTVISDAGTPNTLQPYMCYILGHYLWWVMGNRYEYSSIDIRQSYIFSDNYHYMVNPFCLGLYMMVPYLLVMVMWYRLGPVQQCGYSYGNGYNPISVANTMEQQTITQHTQHAYTVTIYKYLLIPQAWLVFCFINLIYNNQKILYTIVYVPMTLIQSTKLIILLLIIMLYGYSVRLSNNNP